MDLRHPHKIVSFEEVMNMPPEERQHFRPISPKQARRLQQMSPADRGKFAEGVRLAQHARCRRPIPLTEAEIAGLKVDTPEERQLLVECMPFKVYLERLLRHEAR